MQRPAYPPHRYVAAAAAAAAPRPLEPLDRRAYERPLPYPSERGPAPYLRGPPLPYERPAPEPFYVRDASGALWKYSSREDYEQERREREEGRQQQRPRSRSRSRERPAPSAASSSSSSSSSSSAAVHSVERPPSAAAASSAGSAPSAGGASPPPTAAPAPGSQGRHGQSALKKAFKAQVRDAVLEELRKVYVEEGQAAAGGGAGAAAAADPSKIYSREDFKHQARKCTEKLYDMLWATGGRTGGVAIKPAAPSSGGTGAFDAERAAWALDFIKRFLRERQDFLQAKQAAK